jgi:DNA uptake protein ComE-like DNA-binding protein
MRTTVAAAPASRQSGFVLALTVVVLAAVAVAATFLAERVSAALETARADRSAVELQVADFSLRSQLLYRMAVEPRVGGTLGGVRIDGTAYKAEAGFVRLQDARGLFNPNAASPASLARFFDALGVPADAGAALADVLLDFRDGDDLVRLNGAESAEYRRLGLPPPRNGPFASPSELRRLPAWRDLAAPLAVRIDELVALHSSNLVNPETAAAEVLGVLPGIDPPTAQQLVQQRRTGAPIAATVQARIFAAGGGGLYSLTATVPSETLVVTHWADRPGWALRYAVTQTPNSAYGPWRIEYSYRVSGPGSVPDAAAFPGMVGGIDSAAAPVALPFGGN